ncbi:GYDIA family GHMP kinase [Seonamhaeicola sp.]|uniref:GYDIA family GHMP kinase n=1 Tax=Seonamhaeicola sp. TaxID=1912245 RepID=UPI0026189575|nr:GYDIA family GHMP kinase [Seonamhaeicola sp.]
MPEVLEDTKRTPDTERDSSTESKIFDNMATDLNNKTFYSNGKLLLTGEYVVLDGALSLAIPTKFGQSLQIESVDKPILHWKSLDENGTVWFEGAFELSNNGTLKQDFDKLSLTTQFEDVARRLFQIFNAVKQLNPDFLNVEKGYRITTAIDFPRNWGLGTSSTLINNIAQWANVDAFKLLERTFGGSGYDIACAQNDTPITYQIENGSPLINQVAFDPPFKEQLYFVHLNKKQNSREGIAHYKAQNKDHIQDIISEVNIITLKMIACDALEAFEVLVDRHENIIAKVTNQTPVKLLLFNDFNGSIKSLGAWGGDFVLVTSKENPTAYFRDRGFETILPYVDMVL